jgi:prolipoprotein diacylglyceryltransferase
MHVAPANVSDVSGFDRTLRLLRALGLSGVLGGLGALSAMWAFGASPETVAEWRLLVGAMRSVFYACVFSGILILVPVGSLLWWRRRAALRGQRWFRALMLVLLVTIPGLHIGARLTSIALRKAVNAGDVARAAELWDRLGWLFFIALIVFLIASWIATARPGNRSA